MTQPYDISSLLSTLRQSTKRKVFVSYHHGGDQLYYNTFTEAFAESYDIIYDNSLERRIDSDDINYVLQRIRNDFVGGSSCTVVLCGAETPWRKYVDWEIKATLDMEHGLIAVNLPTNVMNADNKYAVPARLHDNIQSGYAVWATWSEFVQSVDSVKLYVEQAIVRPSRLIVNNRHMMARNGTTALCF